MHVTKQSSTGMHRGTVIWATGYLARYMTTRWSTSFLSTLGIFPQIQNNHGGYPFTSQWTTNQRKDRRANSVSQVSGGIS